MVAAHYDDELSLATNKLCFKLGFSYVHVFEIRMKLDDNCFYGNIKYQYKKSDELQCFGWCDI